MRYHYLDALRGFVITLIVVFHASLFLFPGEFADKYPIQDARSSFDLPYDEIADLTAGMMVPVFFLLSGFFSALVWQSRGLKALIKQRLHRIALPLALSTITIIPLNVLTATNFDFQAPLYFLPLVWLRGLQHLWFLWYLLWFVGAFALAVRLKATFEHRWAYWLLVPLTILAQFSMEDALFGADIRSTLIITPRLFLYYGCFFAFGAFMYVTKMEAQRRWSLAALVGLVVVFPVATLLADLAEPSLAIQIVNAVLQATYTWLMCFGSMGLFRLIASQPRPSVRYLADASYWIYLTHMPMVFFAQHQLKDWPINVHVKFVAICLGVALITLLTYELFVRYTGIGAMLHGRRWRDGKRTAPARVGS